VQDDELTIGQHPPKLDALPRVLPRHPFEVRNERVLAVGDHRIVLGVGSPARNQPKNSVMHRENSKGAHYRTLIMTGEDKAKMIR
jgi:hypothetical protein